jgi:hypothetical protein
MVVTIDHSSQLVMTAVDICDDVCSVCDTRVCDATCSLRCDRSLLPCVVVKCDVITIIANNTI